MLGVPATTPQARTGVVAVAGAFLLLPALHPLLLPVVGVPSHLLWFAHALPVALLAYGFGWRGAVGALLFSVAWVVSGEFLFGAGYGTPADGATILALSVAVFLTNALVVGFALAVRAERERRRDQEQLVGAALSTSPEAVILLDETMRIQYANDAAHQLFDARTGQLVDAPLGSLLDEENQSINVYQDENPADTYQVVARTADGNPFAAELACSPVWDSDRNPTACLVTVRDRSERLRQEVADRRTQSLSELGATIASIAHELNNPLAAVVTNAELLRGSTNQQVSEDVDTVVHEARRASGIARQLLRLVRRGEQVRQTVEVSGLVAQVIRGRSASFAAHGIHVNSTSNNEPIGVSIVPGEIEQVLVNLLANAEQAMHSANGHGLLEVEVRRTDDRVEVEIRDDGPGIPPEHVPRLFDAFYTTKPVGIGTGLGLSIAKRIAKDHGGDLILESQPGKGAAFTLRLPVAAPASASVSPPSAMESDSPGEPPATAGNKRVLVVDDEPALRRSLERLLQRRGIDTVGAESAETALEALDVASFDTVLCDIHLGGQSGIDLYRQAVRRQPDLRHSFVFMTGDILSVDLREFFDSTGSRHLAKPFEFAELVREVEQSSAAA